MRPILVAAAAALFAASSAHAIVIRHDRDASDYLADEKEFPFLGWLYVTKAGTRDCLVTLVDPEWVMTAKHCTEGKFREEVAAGTRELTMVGGRKVKIDRIVDLPERPGPPPGNDATLLRLAETLSGVAPVPLYAHDDEIDRVVTLPGWGGSGTGLTGAALEDGKFRVAENRVDAAYDRMIAWRFDDPRSDFTRALALEGISGPGDSGGPALIMTPQGWRVAGISSQQRTFGQKEGTYNVEEYYVRASEIREWALGVIDG